MASTPQLRFPEFTDEWQSKLLGSLVTQMQSGLSRRLSSEDIGLPVIRSNNIRGQSIDASDLSYWYINDPQGAKTSNYILDSGDLLVNFINSTSQIGKFAIYNNETGRNTIFTTNIMRLKFKDGVVSRFIAYKFSTKRYDDHIDSITKPAVNQASFTTVDFKKFIIPLPSKSEQQKIADFLTAVDDKISALEQKVEKLETYKRGVMQKIFTQVIRFKDKNGNLYPEWEEKRLGELVDIKKGAQLNNDTLTENGRYPMLNGGITPSGLTDDYNTEANTVTISEGGNSCGYVSYMSEKFWSGGHLYTLINLRVDDKFIYQLLKFRQDEIMRLRVGSGLPNIQKGDLAKLKLKIPIPKEQQKIATLLTTLDDKIKAEKTRLTVAKQWKKGLLHRMFV